jgi:hypothetical protein
MKLVLVGIVLAAGILFAFQSPTARAMLVQIKGSGGAMASRFVGDLGR